MLGRRNIRPPHFASKVSYSASPQSFVAPYYLAKKRSFFLRFCISKVSDSALATEIYTDPHNRLLRRQHCSSLCLQSEGHEHVANMVSALGHNLVIFQPILGRRDIRPPHFASKVSYSAGAEYTGYGAAPKMQNMGLALQMRDIVLRCKVFPCGSILFFARAKKTAGRRGASSR